MYDNRQRFEARAFLLLLAASSVLFGWLLMPFFDVLFWSVVIAVLFAPVNVRLRDGRGLSPNLSALLTVLFCLVIIILPLSWLLYSCVAEGMALYDRMIAGSTSLIEAVDRLREHFPEAQDWLASYGYTPEQIKAALSKTALSLGSLVAKNTVAIGGGAAHLVTNLALVLYISFFLVRDGGRIRDVMIRALPFGDHREERLFHKFAGVMRATVLSLIPVVGSALIWLPTALYLVATGQYWQGALLMAYGACVIGLADNLLRPLLVGRDTKLPDFLVLLSTLGGFIMFGMDGFVSGPMLAVFFVTVWQIFMEECEEESCPTEKSDADASKD